MHICPKACKCTGLLENKKRSFRICTHLLQVSSKEKKGQRLKKSRLDY